jgi:hypothetical protein
MQNKYSCGNDPQPGDVVEVVNAKEIKGEDFLFIMAAGIKLGNTHTVNDISVNGQIRVGKVYHIHPSRFRLIRRAGEQPQPGDEEVRTPIQDALYATSKFTTDDCTLLADGILMYLKDAGMGIVRQPQPDMAKLLEEKEREIERLKEQVNDLKMDAAAHEYNEIERLRYQEEYERQLLEEKDEAIRELRAGLEDILTINPSAGSFGAEEQFEFMQNKLRELLTKYKQP